MECSMCVTDMRVCECVVLKREREREREGFIYMEMLVLVLETGQLTPGEPYPPRCTRRDWSAEMRIHLW